MGFTIPRVDTILAPYAQKSHAKYVYEYFKITGDPKSAGDCACADEWAMQKVRRDFEQGFQSWEYRFNTVGSSRGDYPFVAISFGIGQGAFERMASEVALQVRMGGQGKEGFKKPVLFPKLTFLYDKNLHGEGKDMEYLFDLALECSSKTMYPDFLSLTGEGYIPSIYKKYGQVISLMGCVDGDELVTYKYRGSLYVESFKRMWNKLSDYYNAIEQIKGNGNHLYLDTSDGNVEIYDTKKGFVRVKKIIRNTSDNWVKVKLEHGRQLLCTKDHPFHTNRGRIYASDLTTNDIVDINVNQYSEEKVNFNNEKAWLLGVLICDGNYTNSIKVSIANKGEDDIEEAYIDRMHKCFGVSVKTVCRQRGKKGIYKDIISNGCVADTIAYLNNKFGGTNKVNRHIPSEVFEWNYTSKLSFLAGMIDADGYINSTSHGGSVVQIGSINKELSLQQMALAQSLGMPAVVYENHYTKDDWSKIRYRVEFAPSEDLLNYMVSKKKIDNYVKSITDRNYRNAHVVNVEDVHRIDYSYDVETESDHFEVSGIYSHNCRASLSPWYVKGGMYPADENDYPVFEGRFNLGAISLHLPMILAKARQENKNFYEVLDYYLEMIRGLHKRTYDFLGEKCASTNPLGFTQGGFLGGTLHPEEKIRPLLKPMTMSFGITALNELQELYNGKSLVEDGKFALEVMQYINDYVNRIKQEDGILYAIYGTPAESLAGLQVEQFRKKYGVINHVSDRAYVSNSFHCGVWEDITPIQKQDLEKRFWDYFNGGKIQYCRYPVSYNRVAQKTLVRRAMDMGFYEGCNLALSYCENCGHEQLDMDVCPKCGSDMITQIDRMNGYIGYTKVHGKSRYNAAKVIEIKERKSM